MYSYNYHTNNNMCYMNELISVVIPVYNVKQYLHRCVNSVLNQTYKSMEIILVDDGSTDGSEIQCDDYKGKDERVKVIHKKNGGLSDARNCGIDLASGKYITFVDSDDMISCEYIEYLYNLIKKNHAQISTCQLISFYDKVPQKKENYNVEIWDGEEAIKKMLLQQGTTTSACAKMYEISLFENIRYPVGKLYEDLGTTYKLLDKATKVVCGYNSYYFYFQRRGSIENQTFYLKQLDEWEMIDELEEFIIKKHPQLIEYVETRKIGVCFHLLFKIPNKQYIDEKKKLKQYICNQRKKYIFNKNISKKVRFGCLISYLGFGTAKGIYKIFRINGKVNM